jgi:hypothetical protein
MKDKLGACTICDDHVIQYLDIFCTGFQIRDLLRYDLA